ncbi:50S ribosomal protein L30 [Priestia taiwanensis]|jgi:large subunit ribosomal protein L30|uniref:Large ribosomal subunit protein uL30 n=1 Tax=Priestia taiwanensis TaxID=1347902 RepID=A0A917AWR6_9BACI|nr:50S ribosomal protein L30 [Priestia taiwanensis]MBM7365100.1 large subunit ribosomal protein L30 [Priestia taiwanensis]GGE84261.1 50S ribosomal protein L30 [Priestia taiwanensis]
MAKKLEITLVRSVIGSKPDQRATIEALGLKKTNQTVVKEENAAMLGMINKVSHLVSVKEI